MMCFPSRHMSHFFDNSILNVLWETTPFLHSGCVVRVDVILSLKDGNKSRPVQ